MFDSGRLARAFEIALEALKADGVRTRSALVALGIAMAIVVCLTTLVERGRAATIRSLEKAGLGNLYLVNRRSPRSGMAGSALSRSDADRLRRLTPARAVLAIRMQQETVTAGGAPFAASLYAVSGPLAGVLSIHARRGRLLGDLDIERKTPFCVVGSEIARLMGLSSVGDGILRTGGRSYQVVGELEPSAAEGASVGEIPSLDWNRAVVVPLGAEPGAAAEADERYPIDVAVLAFPGAAEAESAASLADRIGGSRFGPQGSVRVASPVQTLRQYRQTRKTFDRILWLVCALTAVSAVLSISNLLSASVISRQREIGLRRAVGARSSDIVLQFRAEGLLLGLAGGGAGLAAGLVFSVLTIDRSSPDSSLSLASFSVLAVSCVLIGVATGIRPSLRASRIDPAAALREG